MPDDNPVHTPPRTWLERIKQVFSSDPQTREELLDQLRDTEQHSDVLDGEALRIMEGALQVSDMQVREIMVPRSQMVCIAAEQKAEEFLPTVIKAAHSRFPVIGESKDEVLGILLAKDLLPMLLNNEIKKFDIKHHLRDVTVVPESKRLNVLLKDFRCNRNHMAIVIDEYGGVAGLVTIEDVLEQIVGDIVDEYDVGEGAPIKQVGENEFVIKALTPIEEFNSYFHESFCDDEFDTIGGLVMQQFGYLPKRNENATIGTFHFQVLTADSRRIRLLRAVHNPPPALES